MSPLFWLMKSLLPGILLIFATPSKAFGYADPGTGAFSRYETHELISTEEMIGIPQKAKQISYRPPGG